MLIASSKGLNANIVRPDHQTSVPNIDYRCSLCYQTSYGPVLWFWWCPWVKSYWALNIWLRTTMQAFVWKGGQMCGIPRIGTTINCTILQRYVCASYCYIYLLTRRFKPDSIKNACRPMAMAGSQNWKFGTQEDDNVEAEEVVLRLQGIICNRDLPPIQRPFRVWVICWQSLVYAPSYYLVNLTDDNTCDRWWCWLAFHLLCLRRLLHQWVQSKICSDGMRPMEPWRSGHRQFSKNTYLLMSGTDTTHPASMHFKTGR